MDIYPLQKDDQATAIKANNRNYQRLNTLSSPQNQSKSHRIAFNPYYHFCNQLSKGENTRSTCLRKVKIESSRARNDQDLHLNHPQKALYFGFQNENDYNFRLNRRRRSAQVKLKSVRSFVIRKKNSSNYFRKIREDMDRCEIQVRDTHNKVMFEVMNNSKQIDSKGYRDRSKKIIEYESIYPKSRPMKPLSVNILQNSFSNNRANTLNLKVIPCKSLKKTTKFFRAYEPKQQIQKVPSIEKNQANYSSKQIESSIKKPKLVSHSSLEHNSIQKMTINSSQNQRAPKKIKPKSLHSKKLESRVERSKVYGVCKTIKVQWQTITPSLNDSKSSETKRQTFLPKNEWESNIIQGDLFGRISAIPFKELKIGSDDNANFCSQSCQLIINELNNQIRGKPTDLFQKNDCS